MEAKLEKKNCKVVKYEKVRVDTHFEEHRVNLSEVTDQSPNPNILHAHRANLIRLNITKHLVWDTHAY